MSEIHKDFYQTLGVSPNEDVTNIQNVYRRLAKVYHPDIYVGDKDIANAKMAELNEAWSVLSDPYKRKQYDSNRTEAVLANTDDSLLKTILDNYLAFEEHPEVSINDLPFDKYLFETAISNEQAILNIKAKLDRDQHLRKSQIINTRIVLVPITHTRSYLSSEWNVACDLVVTSKEVICANCRGKGSIGAGKNKQRCPNCNGSGKDLNKLTQTKLENGQCEVSIDEGFTNLKNELGYEISSDPSSLKHISLSKNETQLRCLEPKITQKDKLTDFVTEILLENLTTKVKNRLSHYDKIGRINFVDDSVESSISLKTYLYPLYFCLITLNKRRYFIFCDGVTGNVVLPVIERAKITSKFGKSIRWAGVIFLGLVILGSLIGNDEVSNDIHVPPKSVELPENIAITASGKNSQLTNKDQSLVKQSNEPLTIKPSFECEKANTKSEVLICANEELASLDSDYSELILKIKNKIPDSNLESELLGALDWRQKHCVDYKCVKDWYLTQIKDLQSRSIVDIPIQKHDESTREAEVEDLGKSKNCTSVELLMHSNGC